ncbi:dihydrodipicolinate synthase family protein [Bifidobacterium scardovii]|uniref:Glucose dehydrogenase n=1 Tax=Bifidobacterium scardovii TaxID=158787 RepID=A0A087DJ53_9BIFI|nr:dihydrodipicolinate synthase family protein [Bifidobacterium scardovii]KFI95553.1 glucose dehydrogenase [Bifidobacterium scardovii]MDK6348434.1 dihydrodipicolinate synthase family protein [Bifidobacterium scardovii]MDU8980957.1 dihydrodipicolinate synthase family protein [Bifidobacterium scardovii]BAQ32397.1 dihydrodipicolinate synthase [Bifidobacterium scardovii JCM 12489 = DSM 13734]
MTTQFRGVIPPVVTPLTASGEVDKASFVRSINRMIDAGVDGLFTLGSSGEVAFSTDARRREIIETVMNAVDGRVPVLVGCIDTETNRVIEHAKAAEELGASAIVATCPFYALGGMEEVERHFRLIHDAVPDLPLFAYDIPVCVHTKLPGDLLVRLGKDGVLAGVKDSSNDDVAFRFLADDNAKAGHPLTLLTGQEVVVDGAYMAGADGSVPGLANVEADGYVRMWNAAETGDWDAVRKEQDRLSALMRIVTVPQDVAGFGAGVGAFKTAMALLGVIDTNQMPDPVLPLKDENVKRIAAVLRECGMELARTPDEVSASTEF